ncbi:hypothetical protein NECAME_07136 [Necator americanus]|uniref:Integrator complex subunit 10 n=1 Tax=Necator americanus TaxID=51031 RepID=W2TQA3_NECAM|nr:hypothetical protein NECAME_07136 [Necator americanus]ETN83844.1 hypothetical protein NECAME_07136 [Necator americanus]
MSENYPTARYRMLLISAIRKDICDEFKQLLELQMKIKFGEYDDAINFLNEVMRDNRDFIYKVIEMVADEYTQRGVEDMERFGCFFHHYELDQCVALFRKAADANPSKACPMLLAFLAMRPQAFNAVSGFLMETLRKSSEPPHGLVVFGNSLLTMNFGNLMPDDILFVCDAILRSAFRDSVTNVAGDKVERSGVLLEKLVANLPDKWSPPVMQVVAYALCIARLKMPSLTFNLFLTLWLPSFKGTRQKELKLEFEPSKSFIGHGVLNNVATLCSKLSPSSPEFQQCSRVAGEIEISHLVLLAYLYTRQYGECVEFTSSQQTKDTEDNRHLLAAQFAAHFQLGNIKKTLESALNLLPVVIKNEWFSVDRAVVDGGINMETPFWFIRYTSAGHWLISLLLRTLRLLLTETSEDMLICALMVLSQVDFGTVAFTTFNEAISIAENKKTFKCAGILDFVSNPAVIDRLAFLASTRPECFSSESSENKESEILHMVETRLNAVNESDKIKSSLYFLAKAGNDLVKIIQTS